MAPTTSTRCSPTVTALKRLKHVERVWDEMRRSGVGADVMAEGRIVVAGAYADVGDVTHAIALLERASVNVRHPKLHHLRLVRTRRPLRARRRGAALSRCSCGSSTTRPSSMTWTTDCALSVDLGRRGAVTPPR